jgi:hypothetical protein
MLNPIFIPKTIACLACISGGTYETIAMAEEYQHKSKANNITDTIRFVLYNNQLLFYRGK